MLKTNPGLLLKAYLIQRNITQEQLAKHIGVTLTTINCLCNNRTRFTPVIACKIASSLNVPVEEFLIAQMERDLSKIDAKDLPEKI